ncbi:Hint domain-containing protein, partial [Acidisphaera rubrifaciens]|uniref:Hint domain-containing protein n=1 Tax=Acidisphaera rubrifaciens TaxID=50715 RepID=UPI000662A562
MSGTTYDSNGTHDVAAALGTTDVLVTHDASTPIGQVPVVTVNLTSLAGTLNITSTNGAEAIVNSSLLINVLGTLNYNASGGEILLGTTGSLGSATNATITNGGTFDVGTNTFSGFVGQALNVTYGTGGGTFVVDQDPVSPPGFLSGGININGYGGAGDYIDDKAITFSSIKSYSISYSASNNDETITFKKGAGGAGGTAGTITVNGDPLATGTFAANAGPLHLANDGNGGTLLQCFLAGTALATPDGERAVETLAPGDLVLTASGSAAPITWIGHRTVERARLADADMRDPVVIAAGAIAPGLPARDLRVTADHAILIEDRLIPARLLVNGTTIRQAPIATYTYFHVELDRHDILLAEGLTTESYLDCSDRGRFANSDVASLQPAAQIDAAAVYAAHGYRPLTLDAATVRPIWQALADRAADLGAAPAAPATTEDAGLHLLVDGRRIAPV